MRWRWAKDLDDCSNVVEVVIGRKERVKRLQCACHWVIVVARDVSPQAVEQLCKDTAN